MGQYPAAKKWLGPRISSQGPSVPCHSAMCFQPGSILGTIRRVLRPPPMLSWWSATLLLVKQASLCPSHRLDLPKQGNKVPRAEQYALSFDRKPHCHCSWKIWRLLEETLQSAIYMMIWLCSLWLAWLVFGFPLTLSGSGLWRGPTLPRSVFHLWTWAESLPGSLKPLSTAPDFLWEKGGCGQLVFTIMTGQLEHEWGIKLFRERQWLIKGECEGAHLVLAQNPVTTTMRKKPDPQRESPRGEN